MMYRFKSLPCEYRTSGPNDSQYPKTLQYKHGLFADGQSCPKDLDVTNLFCHGKVKELKLGPSRNQRRKKVKKQPKGKKIILEIRDFSVYCKPYLFGTQKYTGSFEGPLEVHGELW